MSTKSHTEWSKRGFAEMSGATNGTLYLHPNGMAGDQFTIYRRDNISDAEMLAVADRVLAEVQRWRDTVAATTERNRTVVDELAEARAELALLKGKGDA